MNILQSETDKTQPDNALMIYGVLIAFFFLPVAGFLFISNLPIGLPRLFFSRLLTWADILLLYFYATKVERRRFLLWKETWYDVPFYIKWFVLLFLLILCCGMIARLPSLFGFHDNYIITQRAMALIKSNKFGFAFTLVTAGVTEELIIRGYMLPRLELVIKNRYLPLIITSFLFAALHYGYHNLGELIFTFCFAIVFGSHYQNYRSISTLIVMHTLVDIIALSVNHPK
jgi:membrane protease YdiL (CAAX protease family)